MAVPRHRSRRRGDLLRQYHWVRSWSVAFGNAEWDLLPILAKRDRAVTPAELPRAELARRMLIAATSNTWTARATRAPRSQILLEWIVADAISTRCGVPPQIV